MNKTLVSKLREIESVERCLSELGAYDTFNEEEAKKRVVLLYKDNHLVSKLLEGGSNVSAEKLTSRLKGHFKGLKAWRPHRKDREYNADREHLVGLLDCLPPKKRGIFAPDNFMNAAVYGGVGAYILLRAVSSYFGHSEMEVWSNINRIAASFVGLIAGIGAHIEFRNSITSLDDAQYIDDTIRGLKLKES